MRGKTARRLRRLALETEKEGSSMYQFPDGSVRWDGFIRKYKDLKKEWKKSNIFKKEKFFNG